MFWRLKQGLLGVGMAVAAIVALTLPAGLISGQKQTPQNQAKLLPRGTPGDDPKPGDTKPGDTKPVLKPPRERPIQVDVNMVLVNVTVTDPMNRLVTGLEKEHFQIYEDKDEQKVSHFSNEDVPISMGLVFDASGSMSNKIEKSRAAALQFFKTANPQDEFFLVDFNDEPRLIMDFTSAVEDIQTKLNFTQARGRTALLDAIYLSLNQMRRGQNQKKALLVISDGGDNHSRYSENEIKNMVKEADVQIYAIGIFEPFGSRGRTPEELSGPGLLTDVAETTGGRQFPVENLNELPDVAGKIGIELRNQYILGYNPKNAVKDGRWRKIRVKLNPPRGLPPLHVYAKSGYYAPSQ
jgi:Ca-activated chloride channel family protein